jgi:regulator of sirC expression with transglutaminase-like and TPR domain
MDPDSLAKRLEATGALPDEQIELAPTALMLAGLANPAHDLPRAFAQLERLARDLAAAAVAAPDNARARADLLAEVLVGAHGYRGDRDTYDDLANADLVRVIERKRGLPVALAILWLHAGRAQGWAMEGLNFPGHFVVRIGGTDGQTIIDPFAGGKVLGTVDLRKLLKRVGGEEAELTPKHTAAVGNRAILLRLQNNIKQRLLQASDADGARAVLARMLLVAPADISLWHEAGMIDAERGNLRAAAAALAQAAKLAPDTTTRHRIEEQMRKIAARLN